MTEMHEIVREWVVEILEQHEQLVALAVRQRAKFEGWLKFELAGVAEKHGAQSVKVESALDERDPAGGRSDLAFLYTGHRYDLELKTANANWRIPGVCNKNRPITKNIDGIIKDARKLSRCSDQGLVTFVLFPVPLDDNRWTEYLGRIAAELKISLSEQTHCHRHSVDLGKNQFADLVICSFSVPHSQ